MSLRCAAMVLLAFGLIPAFPDPLKSPNPEAIADIAAGTRSEASAAWWGFDPEDATEAIQVAIDSGAAKVTVPYMGRPWIIRPVSLRSHLELVFEPGVLVLAKKDEFKGRGDSLFRATDATDISVRGYGATLRMRKTDYQQAPYEKAEWRMGVSFSGCKRVILEGLRIEGSGGDGIYIGSSGQNRWCEDVVIRDCISSDNHRQGISIISAQNLLIENCVFEGTSGTAPEAGIDFEPDSPDERLVNCVVRNCVFANNQGHEILVYLKPLTNESEDVSIRFENCHARMGNAGMLPEDFRDMDMRGWAGMAVGAARDDGPQGLIEFINCTSENTGKEGVRVFDKSADSVKVRFVNCSWTNPWLGLHREHWNPRIPVLIQLRRESLTQRPGGIEFVDCFVRDEFVRPVVFYEMLEGQHSLRDVSGTITVDLPTTPQMTLGSAPVNVTLSLDEYQKTSDENP